MCGFGGKDTFMTACLDRGRGLYGAAEDVKASRWLATVNQSGREVVMKVLEARAVVLRHAGLPRHDEADKGPRHSSI